MAKGGGAPRNELLLFGAIFIGVVLLWSTPLVYPLKVLVVLFHELSHGLVAMVTGGRIVRIEINAMQGGVCYTQGGSRFLTLSAGYLGSMAVGAGILLAAARSKVDTKIAGGLGAVLIVVTLVYVRSTFGFIFGLGSGAALVAMGAFLPNWVSDVALKVIGTTSCLYAILDIKSDILDRPTVRSDAVMLQEVTGIPSILWGIVWIVVAAFVTWRTLRAAAGGPGKKAG